MIYLLTGAITQDKRMDARPGRPSKGEPNVQNDTQIFI